MPALDLQMIDTLGRALHPASDLMSETEVIMQPLALYRVSQYNLFYHTGCPNTISFIKQGVPIIVVDLHWNISAHGIK